jgi:hypothetical protein
MAVEAVSVRPPTIKDRPAARDAKVTSVVSDVFGALIDRSETGPRFADVKVTLLPVTVPLDQPDKVPV